MFLLPYKKTCEIKAFFKKDRNSQVFTILAYSKKSCKLHDFLRKCLDFHLAAPMSWDSAGDSDKILFWKDFYDFEIAYRNSIASHSACHSDTLCHSSSSSTPSSTNSSRFSFGMLLSVSSRSTMKTVSFYHTLKTFSF